MRLLLSTLTASALLASVASSQGTFEFITATGQFNQAIGISPNGDYVVGGGGTNGFLWSDATGLVTGFGAPAEFWGVTDDGGTIVGNGLNGGTSEGAVWSSGSGITFVGNANGAAGCGSDLSDLNGVSADGTTAVGLSWQGCRTSPVRWTQGVGMTLLAKQDANSSSRCYAVSDDGLVSVGWDQGTPSGQGFSRRACIWTDDNTQFFPATSAANPLGFGEVTDVNSDGSVVCGLSQQRAFRWTAADGFQPLPNVAGLAGSFAANAVSEDGSVIVGVNLDGFPPTPTAVIWTQGGGAQRFSDFLTAQGVTGFSPSDLQNCTGVSADGTRICGWGAGRAWVVTLEGDGPWADLGQGLGGSNGVPSLDGTGTLVAGDPVSIDLTDGLANTSSALVIGFSELAAPFKGGVLVPNPDIIIAGLPTDGTGAWTIASTWPVGVPSDFTVWFQAWITDALGAVGFSASNGLSGTTP